MAMITIDIKAVNPIWSKKGSVGNKKSNPVSAIHPFGPILKNNAIGIDNNAP